MLRSHDMFTHTSRQFTTSLRTGSTSVVPMRATESGKCQTSIMLVWHLHDSVARTGTTAVVPVRKLVVNWREVCVNLSWLRATSGREFWNVQNFGHERI